ncbi:MAG: hypothetical protein H6514_04630 [Acidimicrobiaceae bacterium]|nr:hypothetical protein [Acidimicrobiaceae bacterium]
MFALDAHLLGALALVLVLAATWEPRRAGSEPIDLSHDGGIPPSPVAGRS